MKILLISTTYPTPARPRQGAFNKVLVDALRARHDVRVVAPIPCTQLHQSRSSTRSEADVFHPVYWFPPKIMRKHYGTCYWQSIRPTIARIAKAFQPDIVLGYWLDPDGYAAVRAAKKLCVPCVVMSGGSDLRLLAKSADRQANMRSVLQQSARLIVVSQELIGHARNLGIEAARIDVVHRGIDRNCFRPIPQATARRECQIAVDSIVILWAGRFESVKNPGLLLAAARQWQQVWGKQLRIVMIGAGSLHRELVKQVERDQLRDVVQFLAPMPQCELARYYNAADITVLTSNSEGIPNVLLESIACGTPFVATRVGGIPEIASPGIDQLVTAGDADRLADAVVSCVQQPPHAPRTFEPHDTAAMALQVEQVCLHALQMRKSSSAVGPAADAA